MSRQPATFSIRTIEIELRCLESMKLPELSIMGQFTRPIGHHSTFERWECEGAKMKVQYEAADKKKGMSLEELSVAVANAKGLAEANGKNPADSKVTTFVNMGAGIKKLIVEV